MERVSSGVGVLDKAALVLSAVEFGPASLADLVTRTGLSRPTAHRLATALETHYLLDRDKFGRFVPGPRLAAATHWSLPWSIAAATPAALAALHQATGESVQLYVRRADTRVCVASVERASGLRDTVPTGAVLPLTAGSASHVLLAFDQEVPLAILAMAAFDTDLLEQVRRQGWSHSVGEREAGVASVSAPVRLGDEVVAALSLSGPIQRLTHDPGALYAEQVVAAATRLSEPQ